ncbi:hypothetical protein ACFPZ4_21230, partial [Micromonospora harpali]
MSGAPARPQGPGRAGTDPGPADGHGLTGVADAGAFLARLATPVSPCPSGGPGSVPARPGPCGGAGAPLPPGPPK